MRAPVEEKVTSERLQRLRAWIEQAAGKEVAFVYSDGILRLLDEREALLEALTELENWVTRNVSVEYVVGQPGVRIEALGAARQVLDKVCAP